MQVSPHFAPFPQLLALAKGVVVIRATAARSLKPGGKHNVSERGVREWVRRKRNSERQDSELALQSLTRRSNFVPRGDQTRQRGPASLALARFASAAGVPL